MTRSRSRGAHLELGLVLDHLDQKLDAARRRRVEEHLGSPCAMCRERVRFVGELLDTMRSDRSGPVPALLRAIALAAFTPARTPEASRSVLEALGELLFDSARSPMAAAVRRAVGEARRLRFALRDDALDLEIEREGVATLSLRGQLRAAEPALWTLEIRSAGERRTIRPDAAGAFALDEVPAGPLDVRLNGPAGRFRLPAIEP